MCLCMYVCMCVCCMCVCCVLSHVQLFMTHGLQANSVTHQALLSMEFSKQEYWSRLPFPSPGELPNLEIELVSLASPELAGGFFTISTVYIWAFLVTQ